VVLQLFLLQESGRGLGYFFRGGIDDLTILTGNEKIAFYGIFFAMLSIMPGRL